MSFVSLLLILGRDLDACSFPGRHSLSTGMRSVFLLSVRFTANAFGCKNWLGTYGVGNEVY